MAILALLLCAPASMAQDSANSNAAFWLQERERTRAHMRPSQASRQATRVRRLVPNKRLARPTIWGGPNDHATPGAPAEAAPDAAIAATPSPVDAAQPTDPAIAPAQPANAAPSAPAAPNANAVVQPVPAAEPRPAAERASEAAAASEPATAPAAAPTIAVIGDNVGVMLAQGLADAAVESGGKFTIARKTRDSSGLVRDDFYDWPKNLRELLAGPQKYAAVAIMIGSNDRQELRDSTGRVEVLTPRWRELYTARVAAIAALLKERNIPFFWIGLPIMRAERYSSEIAQLNEIYRAQAESAGGRYVDIWDAFADENGHYSVFGPDVNGQTVKMRTGDGIHFTKAGARKLAFFAEQGMRALLERPNPAPDATTAALPQTQAPQGTTTQGPAPQGLAPVAGAGQQPGPEPLVPLPAPPPKPAFGPILPLTAPPVAPGGELAGPAGASRATQARAALAPALAEGRPAAARPGRADDFTWPHGRSN